ncbi:hemolysin III family protein [Tissierella praeacuta]|uniref:PAQR family membrane homeostasis protein TrhA n=1 Tax=Tissierella praeacuta TaxID=43131 RepID=UPI003341657A
MKNEKSVQLLGKKYTVKEEIANGITHGIGVLFGITALVILLVMSIGKGDRLSIIAFSIYGACFIFMYLSSTLYHSITNERAKGILRVFDHSSIFLFIAGTYTPIALLTMDGALRIGILIAVWFIAIFGIVFKIFTFGKFDRFKAFSLSLYICMGWIAVFTIKPIIRMTSIGFFMWILGGGLLYTLGTIFYSIKKIPYHHAIWHIFVLAASVAHFVGIILYLV